MRRLLVSWWIVAAIGLSVRGLSAQNVPVAPAKSPVYMILPPVVYDHHYDGDLTIRIVATLEELYAICQLDKPHMLACSARNGRSCVIVMVADEIMRRRNWNTGLLLRHEIGHCNGWPADHPDERGVSWPNSFWVAQDYRVKMPRAAERPALGNRDLLRN
jgi:hypothetical protein